VQQALGLAYKQKAMFVEAVAELQKACELSGDSPGMAAVLGHAYAASGKTSEAMNILNTLKELSKRKYVPSYYMAMIYVGLGERDQALHWLEKAYEEQAASLAYLNVDPSMDDLRSDSRFQDLVRRVGLPSAAL
jgi:Flp pilus assembly protein TadD